MNQEFKDTLLKIKLAYGLNQEQIALRLGMTRTYLAAISGGRNAYPLSLKAKLEEMFPDAFTHNVGSDVTVDSALVNKLLSQIEQLVEQNKMLIEQNRRLMEKMLEK